MVKNSLRVSDTLLMKVVYRDAKPPLAKSQKRSLVESEMSMRVPAIRPSTVSPSSYDPVVQDGVSRFSILPLGYR